MKFVSPVLRKVIYPSISKMGLFHRAADEGLAIITYHGVAPEEYKPEDSQLDGNLVTAYQLREQLRLLKKHYSVISPETFVRWRNEQEALPRRAVLLTCDDGLLNCLTDMVPVLQEEKLTCLFFVTGASAQSSRRMLWYEELLLILLRTPKERVDLSVEDVCVSGKLQAREDRRILWWHAVKNLSRLRPEARELFLEKARMQLEVDVREDLNLASGTFCRRFGLMTISELHQLASAGMTIGAHTLTHPVLSLAPSPLGYEEVARSRLELEASLGMPVWAFAYPFGDPQSVTTEILTMPRTAGFTAAFLNTGGGLGTDLPQFALPRVHVTSDMNLGEFEAHVSGFYAVLQRRAARESSGAAAVHA